MRAISLDELKCIQVGILDEIDEFCKENQIKYWIDYGTLLGAVRHKGFIPWDDDIDIGMLRQDYEKFVALFNLRESKNTIRYQVANGEVTNAHMKIFFSKVFDMNTHLKEKGYNSHIAVDVFPYDNVPDNNISLEILRVRQRILMSIHAFRVYKHQPCGSIPRKCLIYLLRIFSKCIPYQVIRRKIIKETRKYRFNKTKRVALLFDWIATANRELFENLSEIEFEGKMYPAPKDYDVWLTNIYGDYMTPPSLDKRSGHVINEIYWIS